MRTAIGFTTAALKEVNEEDLQSFAKSFPCNVFLLKYSDENVPLYGLENDPLGGWRSDYLIFKTTTKAIKPKKEVMSTSGNKTARSVYCLTNMATNRPVPNKHTALCEKANRVIGKPLTEYDEAKDLAIGESIKGATIKLEYFKGEIREFTELYLNGILVERIDKPIKKNEE
jgi:hypothetical protein